MFNICADAARGWQVEKSPGTTHCPICNKCVTRHKFSPMYETIWPAPLSCHLTFILQPCFVLVELQWVHITPLLSFAHPQPEQSGRGTIYIFSSSWRALLLSSASSTISCGAVSIIDAFYAVFVLMKSVCRPSHPEGSTYPRALVFVVPLILQIHLGRHVPDLDHGMDNPQPRVDGGYNDILHDWNLESLIFEAETSGYRSTADFNSRAPW